MTKLDSMLAEIKAARGDDERQHSSEDKMHKLALQHIASGDSAQPHVIAASALRAKDMDFARWCA